MEREQITDLETRADTAPVDRVAMPLLLFPKWLLDKIAAYATGFRTMRQTAERFSKYGLTREMLQDIYGGRVRVEEADVETIQEA